MNTTKLFAVSILAAFLAGCGGGSGGEVSSSAAGPGGMSSAPPQGEIDLSEYRIDENSNIFLNRNNADEVAAIVIKEFLIQSLGASTKGLGTVFDGQLTTDSQTLGISHTLSRTFEFLEANFPNHVFSAPNCGKTPILVVTTDENRSGDYDSGDSIDLTGCESTEVRYGLGYGVDDLLFAGSVEPNSRYEISGTFRIAGLSVGDDHHLFSTTEAGALQIVSSPTNTKSFTFNGSFGADYSTIETGTPQRFAGSVHQNRKIQVNFTPGSNYRVTGQYDFFGNFDNVFGRPGTGFRMNVRDLDISGGPDGSIFDGSFYVLGAGNTSLFFTIRNDGTLVFSADEDGNGSVDFQSGSIDVPLTVQKFSF